MPYSLNVFEVCGFAGVNQPPSLGRLGITVMDPSRKTILYFVLILNHMLYYDNVNLLGYTTKTHIMYNAIGVASWL